MSDFNETTYSGSDCVPKARTTCPCLPLLSWLPSRKIRDLGCSGHEECAPCSRRGRKQLEKPQTRTAFPDCSLYLVFQSRWVACRHQDLGSWQSPLQSGLNERATEGRVSLTANKVWRAGTDPKRNVSVEKGGLVVVPD